MVNTGYYNTRALSPLWSDILYIYVRESHTFRSRVRSLPSSPLSPLPPFSSRSKFPSRLSAKINVPHARSLSLSLSLDGDSLFRSGTFCLFARIRPEDSYREYDERARARERGFVKVSKKICTSMMLLFLTRI